MDLTVVHLHLAAHLPAIIILLWANIRDQVLCPNLLCLQRKPNNHRKVRLGP